MAARRTSTPRDRAATEQRILEATQTVLAREGHRGIGINAIAREAGVGKMLLYRYFGDLPGLIAAYGRSRAFWPTSREVLRGVATAETPADAVTRALLNYLNALRKRPLTLEVLAWELVEQNEITGILEREREALFEEVFAKLAPALHQQRHLDMEAISAVLSGGINHLLLRARHTRLFTGIDLNKDSGWRRLRAGIRQIVEGLFAE